MNTLDKADEFLKLHEEYENKLVILNTFFAKALINSEEDYNKDAVVGISRDLYDEIAKYTDELSKETDINKKVEIALRRDAYLNEMLARYGIIYNSEEKKDVKNRWFYIVLVL